MQYRKFGKLDVQVSALGFGCMRLPTLEGKSGNIELPEAIRMIRYAIDQGVNYIDTAYGYHEKMSEVAVGKALQDGYREKVYLATKQPVWLVNESADFDKLLNEQLEKLQTDHVDFYLMHALNRGSWQDKVLNFDLLSRAEAAKADGRIRHIGFSFHDDLETFKKIVDGYDHWDFCQIQYNYMDIENQAGTKGLQYAAAKGLGVVIMEPLLGGKLARDIPAINPLWESAPVHRTPAEWALQWLWNQPEVSVVLSGMSTMQQVEQNIASAAASSVGSLAAEELNLISTVREQIQKLSPIPCTSCEYCLPCPNGVLIPRNFAIYNEAAMYGDLEGARNAYKYWISDEGKAAQCIQCQECEPKCPQHIHISDWMPVIEEVLGLGRPYVMEP
ncbi:MAG: aldo/keto reductase [Anaerolineaceae bacterium]|nr:aldo/keto reductase [Anaerolineaceae bacterium]